MELPRFKRAAVVLALLSSVSSLPPAKSQDPFIPPRVTQAVDGQIHVTLRGNTPPLARADFDRGVAPDDMLVRRMLLLLKRSPQQEEAPAQLLEEQQDAASPRYHRRLTPEQFGAEFGPAEEDVQAVSGWLRAQGFDINRVAAGRSGIEYSGTALEVRAALHTEIHRYSVHQQCYWSNAADPQIPVALDSTGQGVPDIHALPFTVVVQ